MVNDRAVEPTRKTKFQTAWFFAFHYGFFHLVYAIFLILVFIAPKSSGPISLSLILGSAAIFFANHLFSFFYNRNRDTGEENIGQIMFLPYARILPMHLMIIFGIFLKGAVGLIIFIFMKTTADLIMHIFEHKKLKAPGNTMEKQDLTENGDVLPGPECDKKISNDPGLLNLLIKREEDIRKGRTVSQDQVFNRIKKRLKSQE